ncbi:trimethyllysine hydroxylase isoform X2 [Lycorma delicatula]|uniref:trimethyllysine hydroxylase isoform X2 n=1 Tax=Lycorma delicatula TaxID=130591 RepID=UPI003F50DF5B
MPNSTDIKLFEEYLEIKLDKNLNPLRLNYIWLRDNCRCSRCYSHNLNQRIVNILDIPDHIKPKKWEISDNKLIILWNSEHESEYPLKWLINNLNLEVLPQPVLWSGKISDAVTIKKNDLNSEKKLYDLIRSLFVYGVGFVEDVKPSENATEEVVTALFPVQRTFFGDMWTFSNKMTHFDSAYTTDRLGAHNDNTYFNDAAGLQIFHLLEHDGTGGETLLVDGFRAVKDVEETNREFIDCLKSVSVESMYIEPNRYFTMMSPILHYHPNNQLKQIRFNLLDRSPRIPIPQDKAGLFYKSLKCLTAKINDERGEWWLRLRPGTIAFINNWRILHGRANYTGFRKMCGCYVSMGDFLSKARILKMSTEIYILTISESILTGVGMTSVRMYVGLLKQ